MANSVRLIDYTQPQGDFITFFTELDSELKVGDKVFIVGGNYDNTKYTNKNHSEYNPFNEFAEGYTVTAIDNTNNSNAITLNIKYSLSQFNKNGIDTSIFNPLKVYKTDDELLLEPNQSREVYITKSYFKRGEFNGGTFDDGIFGEFNIEGNDDKYPQREYERQYFANNIGITTDYSNLEVPVNNNNAVFNNKYENLQAVWRNGIFLGGDYQWGKWESKFNTTKKGYIQTLNEIGGIKNLSDVNKYNIKEFNNNNNGFGYSIVNSGNFGRIYTSQTKHHLIINNNTIQIDYLPYPLKQSIENNFKLYIKLFGNINDNIYEIDSVAHNITVNDTLFSEEGDFHIELYVKDSIEKRNTIDTTTILNADIFSGVIDNTYIQGGDIHYCEFKSGIVASKYGRTHWNNGVFNGTKDKAFAEDLRWYNGTFKNGNWRGDNNIVIKNFEIIDGSLYIDIYRKYKHLFEINENVFISYFKKGIGETYFDNYTDLPNINNINFKEFKLVSIVEKELFAQLVLEGNVDSISDVNLQNAKVSQSFFKKGIWENGSWDSGLRKVINDTVSDIVYSNESGTNFLTLTTDNILNIKKGDILDISNLQVVRQLTINIIDDTTNDNRTENYIEPFNSLLKVVNVVGNIITTQFDNLDNIDSDVYVISSITDIEEITPNKTKVTYAIWNNGIFNSGLWLGGIWRDGLMTSGLYFDKENKQIHSVFQDGYWKKGVFDNATFLSGIFEDGNYKNGTVTNICKTDDSETIFINASIDNVEWKRGLLLNGSFNGGKIINGGIKNIQFNGGSYTNGLNIFKSNNNSNSTAPSIIYIDGNGWVQLDQNSYFQKNYSVIFQDLNLYDNPFNNQMFTIKDRNDYASKFQIDVTKIDNPIPFELPILIVNNIDGIAQTEHKYYIADSFNKRILEFDNTNVNIISGFNKVELLKCADTTLYFVDTENDIDVIKTIDKTYYPNNTVIDMSIVKSNTSLKETIFIITENAILYSFEDWNVFKTLDIQNAKKLRAIRKSNSNSVDLFVYTDTILHYILDFNITTQEYTIRESLTINGLDNINVTTFDVNYVDNSISIWFVNDNVIRFNYKDYFTGESNNFIYLNDNTLQFPIKEINLNYNKTKLNIVGLNNNHSLYLAESKLDKNITGFGDVNSTVKFLDSDDSFWYYDSKTSRLIHVKDNVYTNTDIDYLGNVEIIKITKGDGTNKVFSIQKEGNIYKIRKSEYGKLDNFKTFSISGVGVIYDIVYVDKLFILCQNAITGKTVIVAITDQTVTNYVLTDMDYYDYTNNSFEGSTFSFDIIKEGSKYLCMLNADNVYEVVIDTMFNVTQIYTGKTVYDVVLRKEVEYNIQYYSAFFATNTGVYKVISDKITNLQSRWSEFTLYYDAIIDELYLDINNNVIVKNNSFVKLNGAYSSEDYKLDTHVLTDNEVYALSNNRLIKITDIEPTKLKNNIGKLIGIYNQNNLGNDLDLLLNNAKSIVKMDNYLFFIDSITTNNVIRYYNTVNNIIDVININANDLFYIDNKVYYITNDEIGYIDNVLSTTVVETISNTYTKFAYNTTADIFVCLGANGIDIVNGSVTNLTTVDYDDISILEQNSKYIIFAQRGETIDMFSTNVNIPLAWGNVEGIDINNVKNISEKGNDLTVYKDDSIVSLTIDPTNINEDYVKIEDFGFNSFNSDSYIFLYNNSPNSKGIIKTLKTSNNVVIDKSKQLDNVSNGIFKTLTVLDDNHVFALFDDGLYHYDFANNIVSKITKNPVSYRNGNETVPLLSLFDYTIKDITNYNDKIIVLFELKKDNIDSGYYDVAYYNYKNDKYSKVDFVYSNNSYTPNATNYDAIDIDGDYVSTRYEDVGGNGGIRYLFQSQVEPKIDSNNKSLYVYFGDIGNANFVKLIESIDVEIVTSNEVEDLVVNITIDDFNINETPTVTIYPNPNTGEDSLVGTYTLNGNIIQATFENINGFVTGIDYSFHVKTALHSSQIVGTYGNAISDFKVYNGIIQIKDINPINTFEGATIFYELTNPSIGKWNIDSYELRAPIVPTTTVYDLHTSDLINIEKRYVFDTLQEYNNDYDLTIINKGYKVGDTNYSPYVTSRVLVNASINDNVSFNNLGTVKTAHLVSSTWDSGLFVGTWDAPFYNDNKVIEDFSIFVNGTFEGDFYDGFFLGGTMQKSNLYQGHFNSISDISLSANVYSNYRYDIIDAKYKDSIITFTIEGLKLVGDDYINTIISDVNKGSIIKIPQFFKDVIFEVNEIIRGEVKVDGKDEIILVIEKPTIDIEILNQNLFIESFENTKDLFGYYEPKHIFEYENNVYITIVSNFTNFDNSGKYIPLTKPTISINQFNRVVDSQTYQKDGKYYNTIQINLKTTDLAFTQKFYIKENIEIIKEGRFVGHFVIPNYLQLFTTTLNKSYKPFNGVFTSTIQNMYISNIINDSKINVLDVSNIFAHDLMVDNSYITSSNKNAWLSNNIFISGKTDRTWKSGAWLNLDNTGFANGDSQFGDADTINSFEGNSIKIIDIFFEGESYVWIELDSILLNTDVYRYITLRGFTGNKSQLIGANRSKPFRILEIKNNLIKIRNPFLEYQDFDNDKLLIQKQEMLLKGLYGLNVKVCNSDSKNFNNNDFTKQLSDTPTNTTWYQLASNNYNWTLSNNKLVTSSFGKYNIIYQEYLFFKGVEYTINMNYEFSNINSYIEMDFFLNQDLINTINISDVISDAPLITFSFTPVEDYTTFGFRATIGNNFQLRINSIDVSNTINDVVYEFDYGYASISCFNGGDFYGNFNSVWNAGNFRNGTFLEDGKWFGSDENYSYNGSVEITSEKSTSNYLVTVNINNDFIKEGDFIRLDYASIFIQNELKETHEGVYGVVNSDKKLVYESNDYIAGTYNITIVKYRTDYNNTNKLLVDFNANIHNNTTIEEQSLFDSKTINETNKVLVLENNGIPTIDLINKALNEGTPNEFSFDLWFNYNDSGKQPLLSFLDSNLQGANFYIENEKIYFNDIEILGDVTVNTWHNFTFVYNNGSSVRLDNNNLVSVNDITFEDSYSVCYIGRMLENINGDVNIYNFKGKIDEVRFWNIDISSIDVYNKKILNTYVPQITAYYHFENNDTYLPNDYYVLNGSNTYVLKEEDKDFVYNGQNLFIEVDYFADINNAVAFKLLTIEEIRDVGNIINYYLEVILKKVTDLKYQIELKVFYVDVEVNYQIKNLQEYTFDTYHNFFEKTNLILTDDSVYINGVLIGNYTLENRNLFKYTTNTKVHLGKYEIAKDNNVPVAKTEGFVGFVHNVNLWKNVTNDNYLVYRIISGENTDIYNTGDVLTNNLNIYDGNPNNIIIPNFNEDGSQKWEHYIYSSENNYTQSIQESGINIPELDSEFRYVKTNIDTALPSNTWLSGTDFVKIDTSFDAIPSDRTKITKEHYYLGDIEIKNMSNFRFFNKDVSKDGVANLKVTASGYLFFEEKVSDNYPVLTYNDNIGDESYKQTSTTDAIQFNTILDIRKCVIRSEYPSINNIEYADRENEFVIKFYGLPTTIADKQNYYSNHDNSGLYIENMSNVNFTYFAIRIDKINSNILLYTRHLGESDSQKYAGLRRSDGFWSYINDSNKLSYYKDPNKTDFTIKTQTEYSLFIPRFEDMKQGFVDYLINKDYDSLYDNFGIQLYKQFNGKTEITMDLVLEDIGLTNSTIKDLVITPYVYNNPTYDKSEQYLSNSKENNVSRVSVFTNGIFNGNVWNNGIFVNGTATNNNLIWKYGIKHNGTFKGGNELLNYAHWLGGFHTTDTNNLSYVKNLVWYRGQFNGGTWEKGHWLASNLLNEYNNDWSVFNSGEWYSRLDDNTQVIITNLFKDAINGTFEGSYQDWNLVKDDKFTLNGVNGINKYCIINKNTSVDNTGFLDPLLIFNSNDIVVKRNTEYEVTAKVYLPALTDNKRAIKLGVISVYDSNIENIYNIGYGADCIDDTKGYVNIQEFNNAVYELEEGVGIWFNIKHKFNTLENDIIKIGVYGYDINATGNTLNIYIDNIEMIGEDLDVVLSDPYKVENHDSVWHGGIWNSPQVIKDITSGLFYEYTYQNDTFNLYTVKNGRVLDLPKVNSIWLGGLWLRGKFNGGIFANGFWNSVTCDLPNNTIYENKIGASYDDGMSVFTKGMMINSVWEGGKVQSEDKLDVVFGDLISNYELLQNNDFTWDNDFKFKKSNSNVYITSFGRKEFIGYHNDITYNGKDDTNLKIELKRVRNQFNADGIMSVYWKRGTFDKGMFQFSHFDCLDLDQVRQTDIKVGDNKSEFTGLIYSSKWKNGLFNANATDNDYPLLNDEPNSLFYYSNWEKGYWKAVGLDVQGTTDGIQVSNALFMRSIWSAGIFEGGVFDLSIWRSGVSEQCDLYYNGINVTLNKGSNLVYYIGEKNVIGNYVDTEFTNDNTFLSNETFRYVGDVDNFASIWVNGCMKGSIWHGGTWQRGMFRETTFKENQLDFFGNSTTKTSQVGIWLRGAWLSGYFSYYDDTLIKDDNSILQSNGHLKGSDRCLFFSINAEKVTDNSNILGISTDNFNQYLVDSIDKDNRNNYASIYSRTMKKDAKRYFNLFNGSFINGVIYTTIDDYNSVNKMIFSLYSTLGNHYLDTTGNGQLKTVTSSDIFNKTIKIDTSVVELTIPYSNDLPTLKFNTSWIDSNFSFVNNTIINTGGTPSIETSNMWRHNMTNIANPDFGDGTDLSTFDSVIDSDNNSIKVSIAQGCGMKWHENESEGEPKFNNEDEKDYNYQIIDFDLDDFDSDDFVV